MPPKAFLEKNKVERGSRRQIFHLVGDMLGKKNKNATRSAETVKDEEESFEDVEGLITNLGIISALILSFVVGIVLTVPMEELDVADKTALVNFHKGFRDFVDPTRELRKKFNISESMESHKCIQDFEPARTLKPLEYEGFRKFADAVSMNQVRTYVDRDYLNVARHNCFGPRLPSHYLVSFGLSTTLIFFAAIMLSTNLYISAAYLPVRERRDVKNIWWSYGKWLVLVGYLLAIGGIIMFGYVLMLIVVIRFPHQQQFIYGQFVYAVTWGIIGFLSVLLPLLLTIYVSRTTKRRVVPDIQKVPVE